MSKIGFVFMIGMISDTVISQGTTQCTNGVSNSGNSWVVCDTRDNEAWISHSNGAHGSYNVKEICNSLGYVNITKWTGTGTTSCGYSQTNSFPCSSPQSWDTVWTSNPNVRMYTGGDTLCCHVAWICKGFINGTSSTTVMPSISPTSTPTMSPNISPTISPTLLPSTMPNTPSATPTLTPTVSPSINVPHVVTLEPTMNPTILPTTNPTGGPTSNPSANPTIKLTTTTAPTKQTNVPTKSTNAPTSLLITPIGELIVPDTTEGTMDGVELTPNMIENIFDIDANAVSTCYQYDSNSAIFSTVITLTHITHILAITVNIQPPNANINGVAKFLDINNMEQTFETKTITNGYDPSNVQSFVQFQALGANTAESLGIGRIDSNQLTITLNIHADSSIKICGVYIYGIEPPSLEIGAPTTKAKTKKILPIIMWIIIICSCIITVIVAVVIIQRHKNTSKELEFANKQIQMLRRSTVASGTGPDIYTPSLNAVECQPHITKRTPSTADTDQPTGYLERMKKDLMNSGHDGYNNEYKKNHLYLENDALFAANMGYNELQKSASITPLANDEYNNNTNEGGRNNIEPVDDVYASDLPDEPANDGDYQETCNDDVDDDDDVYGRGSVDLTKKDVDTPQEQETPQ